MIKYGFNKTLAEIMNDASINLVKSISMDERCTEIYHNRILREFTNEDLKVMIDHGVALDIMMPFAIDILEENIMSEGEEYPGDLLQTASSVNKEYWQQNGEQKERVQHILEKNIELLSDVLKHIKAL